MKQLAGPARGTSCQVTGLDKTDAQAAGDRVERTAATGDARSNDEDVQIIVRQPVDQRSAVVECLHAVDAATVDAGNVRSDGFGARGDHEVVELH